MFHGVIQKITLAKFFETRCTNSTVLMDNNEFPLRLCVALRTLRCVARDNEPSIVFLFLSPRNANEQRAEVMETGLESYTVTALQEN